MQRVLVISSFNMYFNLLVLLKTNTSLPTSQKNSNQKYKKKTLQILK